MSNEELRTIKDIWEEVERTYTKLGSLLWEIQRMMDKNAK